MGGDLRSPPSRGVVKAGGSVKHCGGGEWVQVAGGGDKEASGRSSRPDSIVAKGVAAFGGSEGCSKGPIQRKGIAKSLLEVIGAEPFIPATAQPSSLMETGSDEMHVPNSGQIYSSDYMEMELGAMPFGPSKAQTNSNRDAISGMEVRSSSCVVTESSEVDLSNSELPCFGDSMEVELGVSYSGHAAAAGSFGVMNATSSMVQLNETTVMGGMDIDAITGEGNFGSNAATFPSDASKESDNLGLLRNAGHSMSLEAADHGPNGIGKYNSLACTSTVCGNATMKTAGLLQPNSAQAKGISANAWNMPQFVKFQNVEVAVAAAKEGKTVMLDRAVIQANRTKLEGSLVGKLMGRKLPFSFLNSELQRRWARFGHFQLITVSSDCFICIFEEHAARDEVLMGGPWIIAGQIIGVNRWTPSFSPSSLEGLTSPIWIRLPLLPLLYWDEESLGRIAAKLGEPISMDAQTSRWGRNSYARVCVRMDLSQQLPKGVWIDGGEGEFFQQVQYEGISLLCFNYGRIGHKAEACISSNGNQGSTPLQNKPGLEYNLATKPPSSTYSECLQQPFASPMLDTSKSASPLEHVHGKQLTAKDKKDDGEWVLVTRKRNKPNQRPNKPAKDSASLPDASPSVEPVVPHPLDMLIPPDPSLSSQPVEPSTSSMEGSQHLCNPSAFTVLDDRLNQKGKSSNGHRGRDRVSKAHFMKELSQLGPIAMKTRKKRKNIFNALNGGDNSPSGP